MAKGPAIVAEEIAQAVGYGIDFHEDPETGECHTAMSPIAKRHINLL